MGFEELSRILRDIDPGAVLVSRPVLERVVQNVTGFTWAVWRVPHSHCFLVDRYTLFKFVEPEELHLPADHSLPQHVILLERPTPDLLSGNQNTLLSRYWRLLFHATIHKELETRLGELSPAGLRERIDAIGPAAFEEAKNVLIHDGHLVPTADDRAAYIEFVAFFLELRFFNPGLIPVCFPSLPHIAEVGAALAHDVDGLGLFRQTRPPGVPDPSPRTDDQSDESHDFYHRLSRQARRAAAAGDTVAAAILHTRAARVAPVALTVLAQEAARQDIHILVGRLQRALGLTDAEADDWRRVLPTLLDKADQGARPVEAAILYDLQRACRDHEETIYTLDVAEWVLSVGKRPIRRPLDSERFVRVPAQLRKAIHRLTAARLSDADRQSLAAKLRVALDRAEDRLRARFRPVLTDALHDAGLQPRSLPEQAALDKTVEELLDRISSSGFLGFADVRDAIARGQMKLPDLNGTHEYLGGDALLRLDKRLATQMDGVYRRAESYTRLLEGMSAIAFGTQFGRWMVTNVVLPFLGAFLLAEFVWMLVFDKRKLAAKAAKAPDSSLSGGSNEELTVAAKEPVPSLQNWLGWSEEQPVAAKAAKEPDPSFWGGWNEEWWFHIGWGVLGLFFLITIRSAAVRAALESTGRSLFRALRFVFWEIPIRVWNTPWVRSLIASPVVQGVLNFGFRPLIVSGVLFIVFQEQLWDTGWAARIITYVAALFAVNTRPGRAVEALLLAGARQFVELIRSTPAVFRWLSDIFRELLYALEWVLARAEDWLRLRGRGGPFSIAIRVIAGLIWMPFAFLLRFYTVVLIEPMINPIKLPLTILFAKIVYPIMLMSPQLLVVDKEATLGYSSPLVEQLTPYLGDVGAFLLVMGTLWLLPDAFTYLFWEMRENWRLFRANRPETLRPVMVGSHGETVKALLHRGIHSGTVPRLYARLRAAEQEAARTDNWRDSRTYRQALRGVEEAVRRFVTRDLVAVLTPGPGNPGWGGPPVRVGEVHLGTNRIRLQLLASELDEPAWLEWEVRSGWVVAGWAKPGFLTALPPGPTRVLENALAYLHKRAGVHLIREQVRSELPKDATHFDISPDGLLVWYGPRETTAPVLYDLCDLADELQPLTPADRRPASGPTLEARRVMFSRVELTWSQWTDVWSARPAEPATEVVQPTYPRFGPTDFTLTLLPSRPQHLAPSIDGVVAVLPMAPVLTIHPDAPPHEAGG